MLQNMKQDFSRFLMAHAGAHCFAAHSHHFWPDVTFEAHQQAWLDAARLSDRKWGDVFSSLIPEVAAGIAGHLGLPDANSLCFAPNTHEFVGRLFSCFPPGKKIRVLTTHSEFYSFRRQLERLEEAGCVDVTRVPAEPFDDFVPRFAAAAKAGHDLVFLSQVFFDSGFCVSPLEDIVAAVKNPETMIVVDGYHGYMAVPTQLSAVASRIFYMAGGYKYAMSGEGACFLHAPEGYGVRPLHTGWFAEVEHLDKPKDGKVSYAPQGGRFWGATFDPSGLYRMRAVLRWLRERELTVEKIHAHVHALQDIFMRHLQSVALPESHLVVPLQETRRGHFLTFRTPQAAAFKAQLAHQQIWTDCRGDRLRFGFALYHSAEDVVQLAAAVRETLR